MKKILVIKQTSLGDVLHASGHIRTIKQSHKQSTLYLLTEKTSADIYRYSPWVDHLIEIDYYCVKHNWYRKPIWAIKHIMNIFSHIRQHAFDLAIDLQGSAKSAVFLYFCRSKNKVIKGNWFGIKGFRNKNLHAIKEMEGVLRAANIPVLDLSMELHVGDTEKKKYMIY